MKTAAILIIGNEILSGRTRDANVQTLARALAAQGIRLDEVRVVADRHTAVVSAVNALRASHDFVFTTGGIGPTHDDITTECMAAAFGRVVVEDPEARAALTEYYGAAQLNEARLKMACVVSGASLIANPLSAAPGFQIGNVFVLPGVPKILEAMLPEVISRLPAGIAIGSRTVTAWLRESEIASELSAIQIAHPGIDIGSYPFMREERFGTALVVRGADATARDAAVSHIASMLAGRGAVHDVD